MICQGKRLPERCPVSARIKLSEDGIVSVMEESGYCGQIDCHTRFDKFWVAFRKMSVNPVREREGERREWARTGGVTAAAAEIRDLGGGFTCRTF